MPCRNSRLLTEKTRHQLQGSELAFGTVLLGHLFFPQHSITKSIVIASVRHIREVGSGSSRHHRSTHNVIAPQEYVKLPGCLSGRKCRVLRVAFPPSLPVLNCAGSQTLFGSCMKYTPFFVFHIINLCNFHNCRGKSNVKNSYKKNNKNIFTSKCA